jgi:hypothetical protein
VSGEASLLAGFRIAELGLQIRLGDGSGRPFLIQTLEQDTLESLSSIPQQVAVGTGHGLGFVSFSELPDIEIPGQLRSCSVVQDISKVRLAGLGSTPHTKPRPFDKTSLRSETELPRADLALRRA